MDPSFADITNKLRSCLKKWEEQRDADAIKCLSKYRLVFRLIGGDIHNFILSQESKQYSQTKDAFIESINKFISGLSQHIALLTSSYPNTTHQNNSGDQIFLQFLDKAVFQKELVFHNQTDFNSQEFYSWLVETYDNIREIFFLSPLDEKIFLRSYDHFNKPSVQLIEQMKLINSKHIINTEERRPQEGFTPGVLNPHYNRWINLPGYIFFELDYDNRFIGYLVLFTEHTYFPDLASTAITATNISPQQSTGYLHMVAIYSDTRIIDSLRSYQFVMDAVKETAIAYGLTEIYEIIRTGDFQNTSMNSHKRAGFSAVYDPFNANGFQHQLFLMKSPASHLTFNY